MLVTRKPQFDTQDDVGIGDGIPPIPEWQYDYVPFDTQYCGIENGQVNPNILNVLARLRAIFQRAHCAPISPTRLHDLACFVIHRLLKIDSENPTLALTECLRYAIALYMFILQGTTYFSHAVILNELSTRLVEYFQILETDLGEACSFHIWVCSIGMVASVGTESYMLYTNKAAVYANYLNIESWYDVCGHMANVLWLETPDTIESFRSHWDSVISSRFNIAMNG